MVSDGTAVLGLGDIGPRASLPVMEGKSALFKTFGGLDSIPLVLDTTDVDEIVETLVRLRPSFGAVNLEDVAAPRCFELERRLIEALDCPVMHDDQHGTAIVLLAALRGAARGAGPRPRRAAGGGLRRGRGGRRVRADPARRGRPRTSSCSTRAVILLPGVPGRRGEGGAGGASATRAASRAGRPRRWRARTCSWACPARTLPEELLALMAPEAIVFALSNPDPEVHPDVARRHAAIVATGRSDFPNQINNVLAFPGVFRGALDAGARRITERDEDRRGGRDLRGGRGRPRARTGSCRARSTRGSRPRSPRRWRRPPSPGRRRAPDGVPRRRALGPPSPCPLRGRCLRSEGAVLPIAPGTLPRSRTVDGRRDAV